MLTFLIFFLTIASVVVTLTPLHSSTHWAVRMWEFPRLQIVAISAVTLVAAIVSGQLVAALLLVCVIGYQSSWIYPYTPFSRAETQIAAKDDVKDITLMAANIEMTNQDRRPILDLIREAEPDVVFLMETDQGWIDDLKPAFENYRTITAEPRDNYYGLMFATKLKARNVEIVYLTEDETPALLAELETETGDVFRFLGLHPRPPVPGETTEARDAQLTYAARFGKVEGMDLVVMGDFNDVVWSRKSEYFKRVGGYLDPRHGRGFVSSFHAKYPFLRFPIDHFFVTEGVVVSEFKRGPYIASDHFPIFGRVRFDKDLAQRLNTPLPKILEETDHQMNDLVERHREILDR